MHRFDSRRADFTPYGFTCELWSPAPMLRPDRHNEVEINFLPGGTLTYLLGGRRTTVPIGHLTVFWAAIPHQIVAWENSEPYYVATLPLTWFLACGFPAAFVHSILAGEIVTDPAPRPDDGLRFEEWIADLQAGRTLHKNAARMEIEARLLRLVGGLPELSAAGPAISASAPTLSHADRLACHIARHYHEPLGAAEIAAAVGLHTNYAMALFRKTFGTTITEFIIQHRISHAQRLLVTTDDPMIDVALGSGFQSLSRFNEAFKRSCGFPPRVYRKAHRPG